ncbi:MAG: outer membrane lipid asymmetry maintenance protein MlaD [Proteobacteria bacterium]|nr:outer membrane lipid asymmetry maintenance protein MlaD [Pseudomonadota bacterium]
MAAVVGMRGNPIEIVLGAVVVSVAVVFAVFVFTVSDTGQVRGYELIARFDTVEGLSVGSDVRLGGIKVGTVAGLDLDPVTYLAVARIGVAADVRIPTDSIVQVVSEGLLGGRYMAIVPGAEDAMLGPGDEIRFTQSAVNIEQLLGRFAGGAGGG